MTGLRRLLTDLGEAARGEALLWRGSDLTGRDVDVLVTDRALADVAAVLRAAGLSAAGAADGHAVWDDGAGALPPIDVLPGAAWPACYPGLTGVLERSTPAEPLRVTSPEDRLLIFAAEAIMGRPLARVAAKARPLLTADSGVSRRLEALAASEDAGPLAHFVVGLAGREYPPGGRLTYRRALALATRSRPARAALRHRVRSRIARR
jgi:hypothetical protein